MARVKFGLAAAMASLVVVGYAGLFAILYASLGAVVQHSHEALFVEKVRTFSRLMTDQLEVGGVLESSKATTDLLDTVILNADGVYAELAGPAMNVRSEFNRAGLAFRGEQDFAFGQHGDDIYFIVMPVVRGDTTLQLRLGFDERPTSATIAKAKRRMFWILSAYLGLSALAAISVGVAIARPVRRLQGAARAIADGAYRQGLQLRTPVRELHALALDLDRMRNELVGANERLRAEIQEKDQLELRRAGLERQLQHRERIETVGTLAGGIAHEFNNILVPIILLSELVLKRLPQTSESRQDVSSVLEAARRARDLVKQILAFSHDISGLVMEPVDLREAVDEAMKLFRPLILPNCQVVIRSEAQCPPVQASRSLVVQLVVNLCKNAYQALAGAPGTVTVDIRDLRLDDAAPGGVPPGRYAELAVSDTGAGMDPATIARIFEPFYTTRSVGEGTGLGLSVVHGIAESFGARILVSSERGKGSTFRVLFPTAQ
ncbi:MAG: HAMP domain-containing protein [Gammaproteobacteria bacterium]|nr:HAMP domain-containing protein [Gammaproteobacteria bacterium]